MGKTWGGSLEAQPLGQSRRKWKVRGEVGAGGGPEWGSGKLALGERETKKEQHWQEAGLGGSQDKREQEWGSEF